MVVRVCGVRATLSGWCGGAGARGSGNVIWFVWLISWLVGAGFFLFFVLGLVFYENRKEKGRNGEDNKDNKMNRKWKRKKEMEK